MVIVAIVLVSFATAFWVAWPLWKTPRAMASRPQRSALELQRERVLGDLKELEFDRRMGKIDMAEYSPLRAELAAQASQVLKQIESQRAPQTAREIPEISQMMPIHTEDEIDEVEIEILIARARLRMKENQKSDEAKWRCECGREMRDADRFCASCGAPRPVVTA